MSRTVDSTDHPVCGFCDFLWLGKMLSKNREPHSRTTHSFGLRLSTWPNWLNSGGGSPGCRSERPDGPQAGRPTARCARMLSNCRHEGHGPSLNQVLEDPQDYPVSILNTSPSTTPKRCRAFDRAPMHCTVTISRPLSFFDTHLWHCRHRDRLHCNSLGRLKSSCRN